MLFRFQYAVTENIPDRFDFRIFHQNLYVENTKNFKIQILKMITYFKPEAFRMKKKMTIAKYAKVASCIKW